MKRYFTVFMAVAMMATLFAVGQIHVMADDYTNGLVAHYDFDALNNGVIADITGNGYDGTYQNVEVGEGKLDGAVDIAGNAGGAWYDNAEKSRVLLPAEAFATADDITIAMLISPDFTGIDGNNCTMMTAGKAWDTQDTFINFWLNHNNGGGVGPHMAIQPTTGNRSHLRTSVKVAANEWSWLVYTHTNGVGTFYIDGTQVSSGNMAASFKSIVDQGAGDICIGASVIFPGDNGFGGLVDEVLVYNRALSVAEIGALEDALVAIKAENGENNNGGSEDPATINPYETVKAGVDATDLSVGTTYDGSEFGIETNGGDNDGGVGTTYNGAWMQYANVAFGDNGAKGITINYISKATRMMEDAAAEIWIDGMEGTGTKVATVALPVPEDRNADYTKLVATVDFDTAITGTHDLYIVLTGTCDNTQDNEYVANVTNFVFAEATSDNAGDEGEEGGEELPSDVKLSATDKEILFYTDFSDLSNLVVRQTTVNNWPNHVDDAVIDPVLDADGNMMMRPDQYIDLGAALLEGQDEIILEFVVKPDAIVNHAAFAGIGANLPNIDEANWWVFGMRDDGAVKFGSKSNDIEVGAGDSGKSDGGMLAVGEWVTIKYEITATTVTVYVNDDEVKSWDVTGQKTLAEMAEIENAQFIFGKEMRWGDTGFSGAVSEIRVTTTEVAENSGNVDDSTNKPVTGDVASVATLLLAGVAALGGLKLRRK